MDYSNKENRLYCGEYELVFSDGAVRVFKNSECLYFNRRPCYVAVKDIGALSIFGEAPYETVTEENQIVTATGHYTGSNGSVFLICDRYCVIGDEIKIERDVKIEKKAERDLGFYTKIGFYMGASEQIEDYDYFSPGEWYRHNEYASDRSIGKNMSADYFWRKETYCGLPMFAMQNISSGETICFSRYASDVKLRTVDRGTDSENYIDPLANIGSLGISRPKPETFLYTYYGAALRKPIDVQVDGLSIDYVYPGGNGETPNADTFSFMRVNHPIEEGFVHRYSIMVSLGRYDSFQEMMKKTWRKVYERLKDEEADIDNRLLFENNMKLLKKVTNEYAEGVWGTPFAAQLPQFDPNSTSAEMGFVGQQTGIGYQLIRWGTLNNDSEAIMKGKGIIDFWVNKTMTDTGCPKVWYQLALEQFEPQPQFIRELGDGLEGILDAYVFMRKNGQKHQKWLDYCIKTADWLTKNQNADGSFYRSYNYDGSMCMDSKANTPCVVRFLSWLYFVTGNDSYKLAAQKAGEWAYENMYIKMEYRGGTCDNSDIMDKEAGLYAMFAFIALYDLTGENKWIEAAKGAADYVETFTYIWNYPIITYYPTMPFNTRHISGQSHIVVGIGAADMYMACGGYEFFRLYILTGDEHYLDYAQFIYMNSKQANDIDGSLGAAIPGLVHESGFFCEQIYHGNYHWLPWCTFVEVDPVSRMVDTFGKYEIAQARKIPYDELVRMNDEVKHRF